jgi:hypothetical protein
MLSRKPQIPEDLQGIDSTLRELRPELSEDRIRSMGARARSRARAEAFGIDHPKESFLRSRLAITLMLVFGFAFSGAGAGLAVEGIGTEGTTSADVQYNVPPQVVTPAPNLSPEVEGDVDEGEEVVDVPEGGVAGESDEPEAQAAPVQDSRQLGAQEGGEELPFTGFAALPVLLMGLALLTAGFVLRRRAGSDSH